MAPQADPLSRLVPRQGTLTAEWKRWFPEAALLTALVVYFVLKLTYFALITDPYVPPDEDTHFGISQLYAHSIMPPADSPASYRYGLLTRVPSTYYLLMGRLLNANVFSLTDLHFLRLANIPLGLLTVMFGYLWMRQFTTNRIARCLFVTMLTNTLMFTFLNASVTYDNLMNLLAAAAWYFLNLFFARRQAAALASFFLCAFAGTLTKMTFLPLAAILFAVLLVRERRALLLPVSDWLPLIRHIRAGTFILSVAALCLLALSVRLYGGNLVRYGHLIPTINQVLTHEQSMQNRIYARNYIVNGYLSGRFTFEEALASIENITHPGDRRGTKSMLRLAQRQATGDLERAGRFEYFKNWIRVIGATAFGVFGHVKILMDSSGLKRYAALFAMAACTAIVVHIAARWRGTREPGVAAQTTTASIVIVAYAIVLFEFNYRQYLNYGHPSVAVQGRYLFPVIVPAYGLVSRYLICYWPRFLQVTVAMLAGAYFLLGDLPFFLHHVGSAWFGLK
jgi:hypothetical protein